MRKIDVAYNPPLPFNGELKKSHEDMTLDELQKELSKSCAKCHGDYTICEECMGCLPGKMLINKLKDNPNEKAMKDKTRGIRKMYGMSPVKKQEMAKELFRDVLVSGDPVSYLVKKCGIDEKRAKERLAVYNKKYVYIRNKVRTMAGMGELKMTKLEPKKMSEIVPKNEKTVPELVAELEKERRDLLKRISEIDSALAIIKAKVG